MRINTDDLDRHLECINALANIGSTSDADTEQLRSLFYVMLEETERAQLCVLNLEPRPEEQLAPPVAEKQKAKKKRKAVNS